VGGCMGYEVLGRVPVGRPKRAWLKVVD